MMASTKTLKEVLARLFKVILDLSTEYIKASKDKAGICNYTKLRALSYKDVTGLYTFDHITLAGCRYVNN